MPIFGLIFWVVGLLFVTHNVAGQTVDQKLFKSSTLIDLLATNSSWTCTNVVEYYLQRVFRYDPNIKAVISYNSYVFQRAKELDLYYQKYKKPMGKLHCVPMIIKDNIDIAGIPSTGGVNALRYSIPQKNALVIERLNAQGAIYLGKANMAQLAIGAIYESDEVGLCQNPFNYDRTCSASSSGSGAAVSGNLVVIALGSDTGGSIIGPSSVQGIFGLRPPHEPTTLEGVIPLDSAHDTIGPLAKTMDDIILTHSILYNRMDIYTNAVESCAKPSTPFRVRIITNFMQAFKKPLFELVVDSQVATIISQGIQRIQSLDPSQVVVENVTLSDADLTLYTQLFTNVTDPYTNCYQACLPFEYNRYFGDSTRYPYNTATSPVHNFRDFYLNPGLNTYWKTVIEASGYDLTKVGDQTYATAACQATCAPYQAALPSYINFVNSKIIDDTVDAVFMPAITTMVPLHTQVGKVLNATQQDNFIMLSAYTGYGLLSMPTGFTAATSTDPQGLSVNMGLLFKSAKTQNAFRVAKLYEAAQSVTKLPNNTPLIPYMPTSNLSCSSPSLIDYLCNIFNSIFKKKSKTTL